MKKLVLSLFYLFCMVASNAAPQYNHICELKEVYQTSNNNKMFCKQYLAGHTYKGTLIRMAGENEELNQVMKTLKVNYIIQFIDANKAKLIIEASPIESYKYDVTARMFAEMLSSKSSIEEYSYSNGIVSFAGDDFTISKDKKQLSTTKNMICTLNRIK